jgi:hypothetical protein
MPGPIVQLGATIKCPHGGTVTPTGGNMRVRAGGSPILMRVGGYLVAGCPFTIATPAGPKPQPCMRVQWLLGSLRARAGGPFLLRSSTGMCFSAEGLPQGPPVIVMTQMRARAI